MFYTYNLSTTPDYDAIIYAIKNSPMELKESLSGLSHTVTVINATKSKHSPTLLSEDGTAWNLFVLSNGSIVAAKFINQLSKVAVAK